MHCLCKKKLSETLSSDRDRDGTPFLLLLSMCICILDKFEYSNAYGLILVMGNQASR